MDILTDRIMWSLSACVNTSNTGWLLYRVTTELQNALNMAAPPVVHCVHVLSKIPRLAVTLREQLLGNAELNTLVTVKDVDPNG